MSSIFGGSRQRSQQQSSSTNYSGNQAYGTVQAATSPWIDTGNQAGTMLRNLLGLGDSRAGADAFNTYRNSAGYASNLDSGMKAITGSRAMAGSMGSGATLKALNKYGNDLNSSYFDKYLTSLFNTAGQGQNALSQLINAGQYSQGSSQSSGTSSGSSNNGMGSFLGSIASAFAASDRRLKTNIREVGKLANGLTVYQYDYVNGNGPYIGVMADEVEKIIPEALGPVIDGYMTVDYSKLPSLEV